MDLVDEQHLARREVRDDADEIAGLLDRGARGRAHLHAELVRDHVGERRLAEARRSVQQHVVERFAAMCRGGDRHLEVLADPVLADVLVEPARTKPRFVLRVFVDARGGDDAIVGHSLYARTRSAESLALR